MIPILKFYILLPFYGIEQYIVSVMYRMNEQIDKEIPMHLPCIHKPEDSMNERTLHMFVRTVKPEDSDIQNVQDKYPKTCTQKNVD